MAAKEIRSDDSAYKRWLSDHPGGFVLNSEKAPKPEYMVLHRSGCNHISWPGLSPGGYTERQYIKICGGNVDELRDWAREHGRPDGDFSKECSSCQPTNPDREASSPEADDTSVIPNGITRNDVVEAIKAIDDGIKHGFNPSSTYDVAFDGKTYPPKAVVGLSAQRVLGQPLKPNEFTGGTDSRGFKVLRTLGFQINTKYGLEHRLASRIRKLHDEMLAKGEMPDSDAIEAGRRTFLSRFGPDVLAGLEGEELLKVMHDRGENDSLVYWLEFKDDSDLPRYYGSIGGGSALKFGIFKSQAGNWMAGPAKSQVALTTEQAAEIATQQRDEMLAAIDEIGKAARGAPLDDERLTQIAERTAPNVGDSAWAHKYISLCLPQVIDPYHAPNYRRFHLIKLLQDPPAEGSRYGGAATLQNIAAGLELDVVALGVALNHLNGNPSRYWRVGTGTEKNRAAEWPKMREGNYVSIGWNDLGDLNGVENSRDGKNDLKELLAKHYPGDPRLIGRKVNELFAFINRVQPGDTVVAADGSTILGIGRFTEDGYSFVPSPDAFGHRRAVEWLDTDEWKLPKPEALRTSFTHLRKHPANLIELERRLLGIKPADSTPETEVSTELRGTPRPLPKLDPMISRIQAVLSRKRQVVLYGPPGTGKTYWAERAARELAARSWHHHTFEDLNDGQRETIIGRDGQDGAIELCSFHPSYGYEDFLEGYRPKEKDGQLVFEMRDGIFKKLCNRAAREPAQSFYLLIDEINRGDIPRVFGELLSVLERDKRGKHIRLPVSGDTFAVPDNVFVIGTMNTADRSIALLDAALRRRFGFIELMPQSGVLKQAKVESLPLGPWLEALNGKILEHLSRDGRNLQVGHSYLLAGEKPLSDADTFTRVLREDIVPLLEEYCYEDYETLYKILGDKIILRSRKCINEEIFLPARRDDLFDALAAQAPEIKASSAAIASEADEIDEELDTDEDGDEHV